MLSNFETLTLPSPRGREVERGEAEAGEREWELGEWGARVSGYGGK